MAMLKLGEKIVSARVVILILSLVLLIPAAYGYIKTRVNYDILSYLPKDIETMEGQDILVDQFGTGAFSLYVVEGMEDKDVSALKSKIEKVDMYQRLYGMTALQTCQYQRICSLKAFMMHLIMTKRMPP